MSAVDIGIDLLNKQGVEYREKLARLTKERDELREALKRVTESASLLSQELSDPGTEALAAIYCANQLLLRTGRSTTC